MVVNNVVQTEFLIRMDYKVMLTWLEPDIELVYRKFLDEAVL